IKNSWSKSREPLSLSDLADEHRRECVTAGLIDEAAGGAEQRQYAWIDVYREFLSQETRLSLAGVGLVKWEIHWPSSFVLPPILKEDSWSLSPEEALNLTQMCLNHLRADRAVELDTKGGTTVDWNALDLFGWQRIARLGPPGGQKNVASWDGPGWRTKYLT